MNISVRTHNRTRMYQGALSDTSKPALHLQYPSEAKGALQIELAGATWLLPHLQGRYDDIIK